MSRKAMAAAMGLATVLAQAAWAQDTLGELVCEFKEGSSWSYEGGAFHSKPPSPLNFEIGKIDLDGQSAVLKTSGSERTGSLRIVRAINANHFLEVVNEGFLNLTTVYDKDPATGLHPAVHSRHFGLLGEPIFAQYTGTCRPK